LLSDLKSGNITMEEYSEAVKEIAEMDKGW
jgi:hypothetical protein